MVINRNIFAMIPYIVEEKFNEWSNYMYKNISFNNDISTAHTTSHAERVLLFALLITYEMQDVLDEGAYDKVAHASIFHDTMRENDWDDEFHGKRASEYYKNFCDKNVIEFHESSWYAIDLHNDNDEIGLKSIENNVDKDKINEYKLIYLILKDADSLDRYRFGKYALDENYLRTNVAREIKDFAFYVVISSETKKREPL